MIRGELFISLLWLGYTVLNDFNPSSAASSTLSQLTHIIMSHWESFHFHFIFTGMPVNASIAQFTS